jgi:hypothetical protein
MNLAVKVDAIVATAAVWLAQKTHCACDQAESEIKKPPVEAVFCWLTLFIEP